MVHTRSIVSIKITCYVGQRHAIAYTAIIRTSADLPFCPRSQHSTLLYFVHQPAHMRYHTTHRHANSQSQRPCALSHYHCPSRHRAGRDQSLSRHRHRSQCRSALIPVRGQQARALRCSQLRGLQRPQRRELQQGRVPRCSLLQRMPCLDAPRCSPLWPQPAGRYQAAPPVPPSCHRPGCPDCAPTTASQ